MTKILCIDDTPDKPEIDNRSLEQTLRDIYKDSSYKVIFERQAKKGIEIAKKDNNVKLVLLDIIFDGQGAEYQGDEVAKRLLEVRPDLKIIVLTRVEPVRKKKKGCKLKKISFGYKPNVVHYVVKKELSTANIQQKFKNLSYAIINDYDNENWQIAYAGECAVNLTNLHTKKTFGINIPITLEKALIECMKSPNKPVELPIGSSLARVHSRINEYVIEKTDWNTWGILSNEGCAKKHLKLVIGSVEPFQILSTPKDPYLTRSEFNSLLNEKLKIFREKIINEIKKITGL